MKPELQQEFETLIENIVSELDHKKVRRAILLGKNYARDKATDIPQFYGDYINILIQLRSAIEKKIEKLFTYTDLDDELEYARLTKELAVIKANILNLQNYIQIYTTQRKISK